MPKRTGATQGDQRARFRWTGHLFQGRFGAVVMDEPHLPAAARYIALNPVVSGLVSRAEDWPWSRTRAQLAAEDDELATVATLRPLIPNFTALLAMPTDAATTTQDRAGPHHRPPVGEAGMDRDARAPARPPFGTRKPGPKPRVERDAARQAQLL